MCRSRKGNACWSNKSNKKNNFGITLKTGNTPNKGDKPRNKTDNKKGKISERVRIDQYLKKH